MQAQRDIAAAVLARAITRLDPDHILFETGWDGWMKYTENREAKCMFAGIPTDLRVDPNERVIWSGVIDGRKIVVAQRPEYRENGYKDAVIAAFRQL